MDLPFDPAIPLLEVYPNKPKTLIQKNISTPMFTTSLCTIAKIWKQLTCSTVGEWIKQLWDIYTMEYYLAIKNKKRKRTMHSVTLCNSMDGPGEHYAK